MHRLSLLRRYAHPVLRASDLRHGMRVAKPRSVRNLGTLRDPEQRSASTSGNRPPIDFLDTQSAFASKNSLELFRAWAIFKACGVKMFVDHCDTLYGTALKVFGSTLVHFIVKRTMFSHFCAGEDTNEIKPRIDELRALGVAGILDYAAEAALHSDSTKSPQSMPDDDLRAITTARIYHYSSEEEADRNAKVFETAVRAVKDTTPEGFAAVKVSALGDPHLLERISTSLNEMRRFFRRMKTLDVGEEGYGIVDSTVLSFEEFHKGWTHFFSDQDETAIRTAFDKMDTEKSGQVDWMEWTYALHPEEMSSLVKTCRVTGPLSKAALNPEELQLLANLQRRVRGIVALAKELDVRVMLDAEWVAIQPAIDHLALATQREFNRGRPVVFTTYQTYLRDSYDDCRIDMERSRREGWAFGAKVVRGAYMVSERQRAKELGIQSPVWDTYEETEQCFHRVINIILDRINEVESCPSVPKAEIMVASHNRHSVALVVNRMQELNLPPSSGIYFGQLLGMSDHVTMTLGKAGYKAYKYVPYGPVDKVMPYLIRRTQENSTFLGSPGVQEERRLVASELKRRLFGSSSSSS